MSSKQNAKDVILRNGLLALTGALIGLTGCTANNSCSAVSTTTAATAADAIRSMAVAQRILNGTPDSSNQFPYVVMLQVTASAAVADCSGILVQPQTVLSAAHCIADPQLGTVQSIQVLVGGAVVNAINWKYNPAYDPSSGSNADYGVDVSVIHLAQSVSSVTLATLTSTQPPTGAQVVDVGYGYNGEGSDGNGSIGQRLYGQLVIQPDTTNPPTYIDGITAVGPKETCEGDSGSPLLLNGVVVGVLSGGDVSGNATNATCQQSTNSIYTSVVNVASFIQSNLCN